VDGQVSPDMKSAQSINANQMIAWLLSVEKGRALIGYVSFSLCLIARFCFIGKTFSGVKRVLLKHKVVKQRHC
jgi:hypothetical protein